MAVPSVKILDHQLKKVNGKGPDVVKKKKHFYPGQYSIQFRFIAVNALRQKKP